MRKFLATRKASSKVGAAVPAAFAMRPRFVVLALAVWVACQAAQASPSPTPTPKPPPAAPLHPTGPVKPMSKPSPSPSEEPSASPSKSKSKSKSKSSPSPATADSSPGDSSSPAAKPSASPKPPKPPKPSPTPPPLKPDAELDAVAEEYIRGYLAARPLQATALGFHEYDGRINEGTRLAIDAELARLRRFDDRLAKFDIAKLGPRPVIDLRLLQAAVKKELFQIQDFGMYD